MVLLLHIQEPFRVRYADDARAAILFLSFKHSSSASLLESFIFAEAALSADSCNDRTLYFWNEERKPRLFSRTHLSSSFSYLFHKTSSESEIQS